MGTQKKGTKEERNKVPPLKRGQRIILCKGKGSKREFNEREASVSKYPRKGSWMTVVIRGNITSCKKNESVLHWRKGHYNIPPRQAERESEARLHRLDDDILVTILTFLVGPEMVLNENELKKPENLVWVRHAKKAEFELAAARAVCMRLRIVCNNYFAQIIARVDANLDALPADQVVDHIHWMIRHRVAIRSLNFIADYGDFLFLETLLNICDTSKLTFVRAIIAVRDSPYPVVSNYVRDPSRYISWWVSQAYNRFTHGVIDLCESDDTITLQDMSEALRVPYSRVPPSYKLLHAAIALNCQNLSHIKVNLVRESGRQDTELWRHLSRELFSMNSIQKLSIALEFSIPGTSFNINWILRNLVNLKELSLRSYRNGLNPNARIRIMSNTLKSLDVSNLSKGDYVCGEIPNLKTLIHSGHIYAGGILLDFGNDAQNRRVPPKISAGEALFYDLNIPPNCEVVSASGCEYEVYDWKYQSVRKARLL